MTPLGQPTLPAGAAVTQSPSGEQGLFVGMSQHRARDTNSPQLPGLRCHTKPRLSQQDNARLWGTVTVPSPFPPPRPGLLRKERGITALCSFIESLGYSSILADWTVRYFCLKCNRYSAWNSYYRFLAQRSYRADTVLAINPGASALA